MTEILKDKTALEGVDVRHWSVLLGRLHATLQTGSFARGVELLDRVCVLAERANHHPDVDLRYASVHLSLVTHSAGGLTERDVALANEISALAAELGLEVGRSPQATEIAIDAMDIPAVVPFWKAAFGYDAKHQGNDWELVDPAGIGPAVWFQQMDAPRPQRNRIHLDVTVPHDVVQERLAAVIAAGGHLVTDRYAPAWWVLADAEGNEVCLCTWQGREGPSGPSGAGVLDSAT